MRVLVIVILVVAALVLLLGMRGGSGKKGDSRGARGNGGTKRVEKAGSGQSAATAPDDNPWRATSVEPGQAACATARAIGGKRFLDSENSVPLLPLADCDAAKCDCRYARHEDRRRNDGDRRMPAASLRTELYEDSGERNRRSSRRGRRKTDWE